MPKPTPFSARLASLMARAGLTDADLAAKVGTSRQHVWRLRTGLREPGLTMLTALAGALGVSVGELLGERCPVHKEKRP